MNLFFVAFVVFVVKRKAVVAMHPARLFRCLLLLAALLGTARLKAERPEAWVEVRSPHFIAYSDAGEAEARKAVKGFEGIRSVFQQVFPALRVDAPRPMVVLVLQDTAAMQRFLPHFFEGRDPSRPAGVFQQGADRDYAILRLDVDLQDSQPYFVLFHEYTHSILHLNFPNLPTWLDEGLADYYGATEIRPEHVYIGRIPRGRLARLKTSVHLPLETLLTVNHLSPHYREGEKKGIFYAQSWAFVHYLLTDTQAQKAGLLKAYLVALQAQAEPLTAARLGFGDLDRLKGVLSQYSRRPTFDFWDLALPVALTDRDFQVRALGAAEALVVRAEFLQHSGQEAAADPLLARAMALDPQLSAAQVALGCGHLLRREAGQAQAAFQAALALGSQDFRVPYQLALLKQNQGLPEASDGAQILAWLEAARTLRPDHPGIHMALSRQHARDPKGALRALAEGREAVALDPGNLTYLANLGTTCLNLDLEPEAVAIGERLERLATGPKERELSAAYATALARFQAAQKVARTEGGGVAPVPEQPPAARLRFSLPSHLASLGTEVQGLVAAGRTGEAIRKVEQALAKANYAYDRTSLRALLTTLRARQQPSPAPPKGRPQP